MAYSYHQFPNGANFQFGSKLVSTRAVSGHISHIATTKVRWKWGEILEMLRQDQIRHIHTNRTHAGARIPKEEFMRIVKGEIARKMVDLNIGSG